MTQKTVEKLREIAPRFVGKTVVVRDRFGFTMTSHSGQKIVETCAVETKGTPTLVIVFDEPDEKIRRVIGSPQIKVKLGQGMRIIKV